MTAGFLGLGLVALTSVASSLTAPTIVSNAYPKSVWPKIMKADDDKCFQCRMVETNRLLIELLTGAADVASSMDRESAAGDTAHSMAKIKGSSSAKADAVGAVVEMIFSSNDPETVDEEMLAQYLG